MRYFSERTKERIDKLRCSRHEPRKQHSCNIDQVNQLALNQDASRQGVKGMMEQDTFCLNARMQI